MIGERSAESIKMDIAAAKKALLEKNGILEGVIC